MLSAVAWCAACLFAWWVSRVVVRFITPPSREPLDAARPDPGLDCRRVHIGAGTAVHDCGHARPGAVYREAAVAAFPEARRAGCRASQIETLARARGSAAGVFRAAVDERRSRLSFCLLRGRLQSGIRQREHSARDSEHGGKQLTTPQATTRCSRHCAHDCSDCRGSRRFRTCEACGHRAGSVSLCERSVQWNPCWRRRTSSAPATSRPFASRFPPGMISTR